VPCRSPRLPKVEQLRFGLVLMEQHPFETSPIEEHQRALRLLQQFITIKPEDFISRIAIIEIHCFNFVCLVKPAEYSVGDSDQCNLEVGIPALQFKNVGVVE
jgi:hypothetical protein